MIYILYKFKIHLCFSMLPGTEKKLYIYKTSRKKNGSDAVVIMMIMIRGHNREWFRNFFLHAYQKFIVTHRHAHKIALCAIQSDFCKVCTLYSKNKYLLSPLGNTSIK